MTATTNTAPLATDGTAWVEGYRDRAPEALKKAVAATGMNLSAAAGNYASDLRRLAQHLERTAQAVEGGEWIGPMSSALTSEDFARTSSRAARYEATSTAWRTLVDDLPADGS